MSEHRTDDPDPVLPEESESEDVTPPDGPEDDPKDMTEHRTDDPDPVLPEESESEDVTPPDGRENDRRPDRE